MSAARTARLLSPSEPAQPQTIEQQARGVVKSLRRTADDLGGCVERMIAIQMAAYPAGWTEDEKREMAERHLFGARS